MENSSRIINRKVLVLLDLWYLLDRKLKEVKADEFQNLGSAAHFCNTICNAICSSNAPNANEGEHDYTRRSSCRRSSRRWSSMRRIALWRSSRWWSTPKSTQRQPDSLSESLKNPDSYQTRGLQDAWASETQETKDECSRHRCARRYGLVRPSKRVRSCSETENSETIAALPNQETPLRFFSQSLW